ncbi:uncharacterized protein LOC143633639 [Bidens hawaiensis]|uniref:uncharacterized protein LOC143633639 n=1 Tax=Bidens hawaiensis TaxID=980011 RepID=UPI00404AA493
MDGNDDVKGAIICEDLTKDNCSFAISSSGKRCVLEDFEDPKGKVEYQCRTSEVMVEIMVDYIESDDCVRACGVNRNATGVSLPDLCEQQRSHPDCAMIELLSSSSVADGPTGSASASASYRREFSPAPAPSI